MPSVKLPKREYTPQTAGYTGTPAPHEFDFPTMIKVEEVDTHTGEV